MYFDFSKYAMNGSNFHSKVVSLTGSQNMDVSLIKVIILKHGKFVSLQITQRSLRVIRHAGIQTYYN